MVAGGLACLAIAASHWFRLVRLDVLGRWPAVLRGVFGVRARVHAAGSSQLPVPARLDRQISRT